MLAQQQPAEVREHAARRVVRVRLRVREQVVRAVVARPGDRKALVLLAVRQQQQHAQRSRRLARPARQQPARAGRNTEPAHRVHEEPERLRGRAISIRAERHVHRPVHAQRVQSAQVQQHRPSHPLHHRHAQLRVTLVVLS